MSLGTVNKAAFKAFITAGRYEDPKKRGLQEVPRETPLIAEDEIVPAYVEGEEYRGPVDEKRLALASGSGSLFPTETVLYKSTNRDYDVSFLYDKSLTIRPPFFHVNIIFDTRTFKTETDAPIPITLHRGRDTTGPIYGTVQSIERHTTATIYPREFNPSFPFATITVDIDAHITKEYCNFSFSLSSPHDESGGDGGGKQVVQRFQWKQCESSEEVLELCRSRPEGLEGHDWCWVDRKNERGMKLFYIPPDTPGYASTSTSTTTSTDTKKKSSSSTGFFGRKKDKEKDVKLKGKQEGKCLAVFVAGKSHSKMNPMKIAARVRWFDDVWDEGGVDGSWGEEGKVAAFLALLGYGEKTRRVKTSGGAF